MIQARAQETLADSRSDWELTRHLRRWRATFVVTLLVVAALVAAEYVATRAATERLAHNSTVLRAAASAQALAWTGESAVRGFALRGDSSAPARAIGARDSLVAVLSDLLVLTAENPTQQARVESLSVAVQRWVSDVVDPILGGSPLTGALAEDATDAFDDVSRHFHELIAHQATQRLDALRDPGTTLLAGTGIILLSLVVIALAFARVSKRLVVESEDARRQRDLLVQQATEMEEQALQLEQQATVLEDQAADLEHRIAERDETHRLLEETTAYLDSAVESAPIGVAFFDRNLRFVRVNEALASMHGLSASAHVGHTIAEVVPGVAPSITPILSRVLRTGAAESDEAVDFTPAATEGPRRWRLTCYPLRATGRPPFGVGVMVLDVTERTQLEEQLRQAQKMEAVGRLAGGVAHDFNNVLTVIQSYAELMASDLGTGAPGHEEIQAIRGAADRAAALARQLLSFSRREVVIPRVIDVNGVLLGMKGILERLMRQGVELRIELSDAPLLVRADAGQLEQVLMNLAINAVDAMPDGGVLHVSSAQVHDAHLPDGPGDGTVVEIAVSDTGTGMTDAVRQRLFEPFFTTKPAGQGTGLGLATAYAIMRAADGIIRVASEPGKGARFAVLLPSRSDAERELETRQSPHRGVLVARDGETILLVEDEPAIRQALARVLAGHGYRVIEASNGGEALRLAEAEPGHIDLMLTDVMMPGIGGKELVQRLLVTRPQTRVILMSGYTDDDLLRQDLGNARYVFLQKPFAAREAVAAIRQLLDSD